MMALGLRFDGLGGAAAKFVAALLALATLAVVFATASVAGVGAALSPGHAVLSARADEVPAEQRAVMAAAAATCGLPWQVLAGIAKVESDFGRNMATSSAGAVGYGQFLPATWAVYGEGGNPDDYRDALPAMARYLCANGGPTRLHDAIFAYNHAEWYVRDVLGAAAVYGYAAPSGGLSPAGRGSPLASRIIAIARSQLGRPYVWGGADPRTSFDCSGLVQWSFHQAGIGLPRTAQQQYDATAHVAVADLRPGDLLFFSGTDPQDPSPITHVGLYEGDGRMVSASNPAAGIEEVPALGGYWGQHLVAGGRVEDTVAPGAPG